MRFCCGIAIHDARELEASRQTPIVVATELEHDAISLSEAMRLRRDEALLPFEAEQWIGNDAARRHVDVHRPEVVSVLAVVGITEAGATAGKRPVRTKDRG
jgi:hypothetical protein